MASLPSFYEKNSFMNITVLLVDDDPTVLSILSAMLKASKYKELSIMEITVTAVKNSSEALSTLQVQRNNIDLVITDYHMPGMNGIELTKIIDQEFDKLPVVVMSSDTNNEIEQETISSGGLCFLTKPVKPNDLKNIWQYALNSKKKGKCISTDHCGDNGGDDDGDKDDDNNNSNVVVPRPCNKDIVVSNGGLKDRGSSSDNNKKKGWTRKPYTGSISQDESNRDENVNGDVVEEERKRKLNEDFEDDNDEDDDDDDDADSRPSATKKAKVVWTNSLHNLFLQAIRHIGLDKAVPKKILEFMSVPGLTRENIASHLQKYRIFLKKVAERGAMQSGMLSNRTMKSNFVYGLVNSSQPYCNHTVPYGTSLSHRPYDSELGHGHGQSRLLMNNNNVSHNHCLYSHLNRPNRLGSTSLLLNRGNAAMIQTPKFQHEEKGSLFQMGMNQGRISQTSQLHGIGTQYQTSNGSGLNLNPNPKNYSITTYAGIRLNDKGDLIGIGSLQVNGNESAKANSDLGHNVDYMKWNLNNNFNGHGSSSIHQGSGNHSAQKPSTTSSSSSSSLASLLSQALQPFLSNGAGANKGQSQSNTVAKGHVDSVFPEYDKLSNLSGQNKLGGLAELPCDPSNFQFNDYQIQGGSFQNLEAEESTFEMSNLLQAIAIEDINGWSYDNISQAGSNGETLNSAAASASASAAASELYSPTLDKNPNQEKGGGDFTELPYFNQDWDEDEFMESLFDYGMR